MSELITILKTSDKREIAYNYIATNKLKVTEIMQAAKELNIYINPKLTKNEKIEKLIENTIGAKLRIKALMYK